MRRFLIVLAAVLGVGACGASSDTVDTAGSAADTLTRRQRDSLLSAVPIPGAARIRDAQEAVDQTRERAGRLDTIR